MAYIVVYQREDGSSGLEECADLDLAIVTAERLRNVDAIERPRIMKTEELTYDFKPYYRVEVTAASNAAASAPADATDHAAPMAPPVPAADADKDTFTQEAAAAEHAGDDAEPEHEPEFSGAYAADTVEEDVADVEPGAQTIDTEHMEDASLEGETPTVTSGLFGDRSAVADRLGDFPSVSGDDDDDPTPPRRGLFGR